MYLLLLNLFRKLVRQGPGGTAVSMNSATPGLLHGAPRRPLMISDTIGLR